MGGRNLVPKTSWWESKKVMVGAAIIILVVLVAVVAAGYALNWGWTGVPTFYKTTMITVGTPSPSNGKRVITALDEQPAKTFWDWLQLLGVLAIPIVVGFGTAFFTRRQTETSEANAENQRQEELLRTYFDTISELLLDREPNSNPHVQSIVRARTLAVLHMLTTERKAIVLRFLHDVNLLQYVKHSLYMLDLGSADLIKVDLSGATLSESSLVRTILVGVNLTKANLIGANLTRAYLNFADLTEANLARVNLTKANLSGANLSGADLSGADLSGTRVTRKQLEAARNVTPEQLAQIRSPALTATQEAK